MPVVAMLANGAIELDSTSKQMILSSLSSIDDGDEDCDVLGVLLSDGHRSADTVKWNSIVLGSVVVADASVRRRRCHELRQILSAQFPTLGTSGNFVFLSRDGWPILKQHESLVRASKVINERNAIEIQKNFGPEKCRSAVITQTGEVLGFIFCDLNATLLQVRASIDEQLKDTRCLKADYHFKDRNGWPVSHPQETLLSLCDIWANESIVVQPSPAERIPRPQSEISETHVLSFSSRPSSAVDEQDHGSNRNSVITTRKTRQTLKSYLPTWKTKDTGGQGDQNSEMSAKLGLVAKPILLSYVRAEAASHAVSLKEALKKSGFSVYLDVHEIRSGNDWQDALNFAVSNCTVFVPLITPMYGRTQWTNREVKLADVLGKFIIPVNFLERWPPECLAIQFASTQYVNWKIVPDTDHGKFSESDRCPQDYKVWEPAYITQVAAEICERFKLMFSKEETLQKLRHTVKFRSRGPKPVESKYALDNLASINEEPTDGTKNQIVVISAHPKDLLFADKVKKSLLDKNYDVWCSIEMLEDFSSDGEVFYSGGVSSGGQPLSTIPEGDTYSPLPKLPLSRLDTDDKRALCRLSSQMSNLSVMSESLTPDKIERLSKFQQKVNQAGLVVILVSEAYTKSTTSVQQIFYCEHRKKVVLVKTDNNPVPSIFSMLMGTDTLSDANSPQFMSNFLGQVKRALNPQTSTTSKEESTEAKMQYLVHFMKKNLPEFDHCVYISGSSCFQNKRSEEICKAIGRTLAKIKDVNVVTGGFYGAGDIVARAFEEARVLEVPNNYAEKPVVHVLPVEDPKDFSQKAPQNENGFFESVSYGKTVFLGDSVKERESAVARLFDVCIVIEGGPGAAHEVEEFIWNDHFVIPIISSGGAAGGQFGVPLKILETPPSVSETDWSVLAEKEATPEAVASAVANIVQSLNRAVVEHAKKEAANPKPGRGKVRRRSKKSQRKRKSTLQPVREESVDLIKAPPIIENVQNGHETEDEYNNETMCSGPHRWQKFFKFWKPARLIS